MRFLSFSQPWLWSITDLVVPPGSQLEAKRIENRSWPPPIAQIGQRFALHAAKSWDEDAIPLFMRLGIDWFPARRALYPAGCIVGVATIDRVVTEPRTLRPGQVPWFFGEFGWILTDVQRIPDPIPMKGGQGLRELADIVAADLFQQLKAA